MSGFKCRCDTGHVFKACNKQVKCILFKELFMCFVVFKSLLPVFTFAALLYLKALLPPTVDQWQKCVLRHLHIHVHTFVCVSISCTEFL